MSQDQGGSPGDSDAAFDAAWGNDDDWAAEEGDEQAGHVVSDDQLEGEQMQHASSPGRSEDSLGSLDNEAEKLLDEYEADEYELQLQQAQGHAIWDDLGTMDDQNGVGLQEHEPAAPRPLKRPASTEADAFQGMDDSETEEPDAEAGASRASTSGKLISDSEPAAQGPAQPAGASGAQTAAAPAVKRRRVVGGHSVPSVQGGGGGGGQAAPVTSTTSPAAAQPAADACPHPGYYGGMCVLCQAPEPEDPEQEVLRVAPSGNRPTSSSSQKQPSRTTKQPAPTAPSAPALMQLKHLHHKGVLKVSASEANRIRGGEFKRLTSAKRLVLILDLDHTLLNSVGPEHTQLLHDILERNKDNPAPLLYCLRDKNLWTKLRPGIHAFLRSLSPLYELHIYTMGDRGYAAEIRRLLDPHNQLFKSAISQCDSTSRSNKDLDVAMAEDKLVVILDDTEQVWPNHRLNLIKVDRYHFFPASLKQWGIAQPSFLEQHVDEDEQEGTLATCASVLKHIHSMFFSESVSLPLEQRDVRQYLSRRRQLVLQGCVLVFSSCWPLDYSNPPSHPLWQLAKALGAEVESRYYTETATHVVTAAADTEKAHTARRDGKHVVSPQWLHACSFRWRKVSESDYPPQSKRKGAGPTAAADQAQAGQADQELKLALASAAGGDGS